MKKKAQENPKRQPFKLSNNPLQNKKLKKDKLSLKLGSGARIFPKSPHVIDLRKKILEKRRLNVPSARASKETFLRAVKSSVQRLMHLSVLYYALARLLTFDKFFRGQSRLLRGQPRGKNSLAVDFASGRSPGEESGWQSLTVVNFFEFIFFLVWKIFTTILKILVSSLSFLKIIARPFQLMGRLLISFKKNVFKIIFYSKNSKKVFNQESKQWLEFILLKVKNIFYSLKLSSPSSCFKGLLSFILISFLLVVPFRALTYYQELEFLKGKVFDSTAQALKHLELARQEAAGLDLRGASREFSYAAQGFDLAQNEFSQEGNILLSILKVIPFKGKDITAAEYLLGAGEALSRTGEYLSAGLSFIKADEKEDQSLTQDLAYLQERLRLALPEIRLANQNLKKVELRFVPEPYQGLLEGVKKILPPLEDQLVTSLTLLEDLKVILGAERPMRYLFIFQNNTELRPTGGFMGSFALVDIYKGEIQNIEIPGGGTYDLQGQLGVKVISPMPLHLVNPHWQFQDANWFADFPTSARKIIWFYERAGGPTVDGLVAMNATLMEDILTHLGPIEMPEYSQVIKAENFIRQTQIEVELEYNKEENKPKQFIADLAPKIISKIFTSRQDEILGLAMVLNNGLARKDLLLYFNEPELQEAILARDWAGQIHESDFNYLKIVHTNISGGKTDGVIKEKIKHLSEVQPDGSIIDTLTIIKSHQGKKGDVFEGNRNRDWLRIYVPQGSVLLEAKGFEAPAPELFRKPEDGYVPDLDLAMIERQENFHEASGTRLTTEFNKTVFANWMQVEPGRTSRVTLKYKLPFQLTGQLVPENKSASLFSNWFSNLWLAKDTFISYSLFVEKQPGSWDSEFSSELKLPEKLELVWQYPQGLEQKSQGLEYQSKLARDLFYSAVFRK